MPPSLPDWDHVARVLAAVADLAPTERDARLAEEPPEVRTEVASLLCLDALATEFFEAGPRDALDGAVRADADLHPGDRVGPWSVEAEVGRGGMGTVYRARRVDGRAEQTVALKVIRRGMDTADVLARFRRERAVLAGLDAPFVARFLDAGETDDGRPFLALEYVEGEPLTDYASAHQLGVDDRLRLFVQVCEAVAYAHRRLVVHRDLKPSNVLVTEDDQGRPRVKLLDFGVARLLDDTAPDLTQGPRAPLTPAYAAPEQKAGAVVTTAADVYALGVLLFELLTGARPDGPESQPSRAVTAEAATAIGTTPTALTARLRGDLDAVCAKAFRAAPDDRYASADAIARDLQRYLDGFPVHARKGTRRYRARAFVRRHRLGVTLAAGALVLLLAFVGALAVALDRASAERDRAEAEALRAARVTDFLRGVVAEANPRSTTGSGSVQAALDAASRRALAGLGDDPAAEAAVLDAAGQAYVELGAYDEAEPLLSRALALRAEQAETDGQADALSDSYRALGRWAVASGRYAAADSLAQVALARARSAAPRASALGMLGALRSIEGDNEEAVRLLRESADLYASVGRDGELPRAHVISRLGFTLAQRGDTEAAEALLQEALTVQRRRLPEAHPEIASTLTSLGAFYFRLDSLDAAARVTREAADVAARALGPGHPSVARAVSNLAIYAAMQGDLAAAETRAREALSLRQAALGPDHPGVARTLSTLGQILTDQGRPADAIAPIRDAERITRATYGDDSPETARLEATLAQALLDGGDAAAAVRLLESALRVKQALPDQPEVPATRLLLGDALVEVGDCDQARPHLQAGLAEADESLEATLRLHSALAACDGSEASRQAAQAVLAEAPAVLAARLAPRLQTP
ncbi:MAG: serine/threonine-protein kinase [Bacteroidota bacterium]